MSALLVSGTLTLGTTDWDGVVHNSVPGGYALYAAAAGRRRLLLPTRIVGAVGTDFSYRGQGHDLEIPFASGDDGAHIAHRFAEALVVHPDAVLTVPLSLELLEAVARRRPQVIEPYRRVHVTELPQHDLAEVGRESAHGLTLPEALGVAISEAPNGARIVTLYVTTRKDPVQVQLTFAFSCRRIKKSARSAPTIDRLTTATHC